MFKNKRKLLFLLPTVLAALLLLSACLEPRVGFQGRLTDSGGANVPDGTYEVTVRFWTNEAGGTSVFTETKQISVQDGLFNMDLDDFPPHIFSAEVSSLDDSLYMEVTVEGETLSPRRKVPGAPYAHGLVAGSGVVGERLDEDHVSDGGFDAALTVINNRPSFNLDAGYGIRAASSNAAVYADNVAGDKTIDDEGDGEIDVDPSEKPEDNPDIILGGYYARIFDQQIDTDTGGGAGVIASDQSLSFSDMYLRSNDELYLFKNYFTETIGTSEFRIYNGPVDVQARLNNAGDWSVEGSVTGGGADYAERIDVEGSEFEYEPGDVLVISDQQDRAVALSTTPYSSAVIGVYSAQPGFVAGGSSPNDAIALESRARHAAGLEEEEITTTQVQIDDGAIEVAIAGIVPVKVTDEGGAIQRGDLLTTSSLTGHAMKATDPGVGTVLGKAMGTLESGNGVIPVLVILQ
jgi:hypothetical protein